MRIHAPPPKKKKIFIHQNGRKIGLHKTLDSRLFNGFSVLVSFCYTISSVPYVWQTKLHGYLSVFDSHVKDVLYINYLTHFITGTYNNNNNNNRR